MLSWTLDKKDFIFVNKVAQKASKVYLFTNILFNIILGVTLLLMALDTLIMFLLKNNIRVLLMIAIDVIVIYFLCLKRVSYKRKISCKHIQQLSADSTINYNLSLSANNMSVNNVSYAKTEIYAVFLLKDYIVFILNDKSSFIIKPDTFKDQICKWIEENDLYVYSWDAYSGTEVAVKNTRTRMVRKAKPAIAVMIILSIRFYITGIKNKTISDKIDSMEPVESFTFDLNEYIYDQMYNVYKYYEYTQDFEETYNIYYSYVNQAANVLSKIHYKNEDIQKNKELLILNGNDSCYIKYFKPVNSEYFCLEVIKPDKTVTIQKTENSCFVTTIQNPSMYTNKDLYNAITEFEYVRSEYPYHKKAGYYHGIVNIELQKDKFNGKESLIYRMGIEDITSITESKNQEFKIVLNNIPQDDINTFMLLLESVCDKKQILNSDFSQIIKEFNKIITY